VPELREIDALTVGIALRVGERIGSINLRKESILIAE
jgi:hypothetical protein